MTYQKYLKNLKRKKIIIIFIQILLFITIILLWEYLSKNNIINSFIMSSPSNILKTITNLYNQNNLFKHIYTTLYEVIISFTITSILSLLLAIILYNFNTLHKILEPYILMFNSLPKVALGPIIIIWIGANIKSVIVISILISIIVSFQSIYNGFINTDKNKIKLLKTFNSSKKDILLYLIIPSNKQTIINTLKVNISMCLIGTVTGEFLSSKEGIGYLILYGSQVFNLNLVMTGIFLLLIISLILYKIIKIIH